MIWNEAMGMPWREKCTSKEIFVGLNVVIADLTQPIKNESVRRMVKESKNGCSWGAWFSSKVNETFGVGLWKYFFL